MRVIRFRDPGVQWDSFDRRYENGRGSRDLGHGAYPPAYPRCPSVHAARDRAVANNGVFAVATALQSGVTPLYCPGGLWGNLGPVALTAGTIETASAGPAHSNMQPYAVMNIGICTGGGKVYPTNGSELPSNTNNDGYLGEVRAFAMDVLPDGWLPCSGQTLSFADNNVLYALMGNTWGGIIRVFACLTCAAASSSELDRGRA